MTTKPRAKKFRIRRSAPLSGAAQGAEASEEAPQAVAAQGGARPARPAAPPSPEPAAQAGEVASASEVAGETDIEQIRREGLTGRQLRMARRIAHKHGLAPTSDFDAVRLLRQKGVDPFQRANMLELVVPQQGGGGGPQQPPLPETVPPPQKNLPSTEVMTEDIRAREIRKMQRDIVRRRQRRTMLLLTRLAFFVGLPTLIAGWYFYIIASPLYATKTEFLIQQAENQTSQLGGLFSGTGFATSQDSIAVQSYLESRDAMLRLSQDEGFKAHFQNENLDPIQRLDPDATNEDAYKIYKKNVKLGYDPTEGLIRMEVIAASPEASARFSEALVRYAEERVDHLTQRLREDQMRGARESYAEAERKVLAAQERVVALKEQTNVVDAQGVIAAQLQQVTTFQLQLSEKRLALDTMLANARPNQARVTAMRGEIERLEALIAEMQAQLTSSGSNQESLARASSQLLVAQAELETRQLMLAQASQQLETARIEANRQTRYLSLSVAPVAPDEATYPKAFENTILAFLIFAGVYLMVSLTASILREQVTS